VGTRSHLLSTDSPVVDSAVNIYAVTHTQHTHIGIRTTSDSFSYQKCIKKFPSIDFSVYLSIWAGGAFALVPSPFPSPSPSLFLFFTKLGCGMLMSVCECVCVGVCVWQVGIRRQRATRTLCLPETFGILIISQERRVKINAEYRKNCVTSEHQE